MFQAQYLNDFGDFTPAKMQWTSSIPYNFKDINPQSKWYGLKAKDFSCKRLYKTEQCWVYTEKLFRISSVDEEALVYLFSMWLETEMK